MTGDWDAKRQTLTERIAMAEKDRDDFVDREGAIFILQISGTTFDRIAKGAFEDVRIAVGNSFRYPVKELEAYREFRKIYKQSNRDKKRLTWSEVTPFVSTLEERIRVLSWILNPMFVRGKQNAKSALRLQKDHPKDFERAERVLRELGFDMEELCQRLIPDASSRPGFLSPDMKNKTKPDDKSNF